MCGIAGVFGYRREGGDAGRGALGRIAAQMADAMARRGPDDTGVYCDPAAGVLLVQRRLAILDLSPAGHQPMFSACGRYGIVFNGEVYNFAEIRTELLARGHVIHSHCDTEVILHAYMEWGREALPRLRGMFAFVILDRSGAEPKLFCARDRFGIKPLVMAQRPAGNGSGAMEFCFASSCMALTAAGLVRPRVRGGAIWEYCRTGAVAQPGTIFEDVRQLRPGHWLEVTAEGMGPEICWYDLARETAGLRGELAGLDFVGQVGRIRATLEEAARYHAIADVPVGAFLSGGIDSSAVAGLLAGQVSGAIKAFTIGFEGQGEVPDEIAAARESADYIGAEHHAVVIRDADAAGAFDDFIATLDQPSMDGFNTYLVSRAAAQAGVKVTLSGLGGDELFAGYPHYADIAAAQGRTLLPGVRPLLRVLHGLRPNRLTRRWLYRGIDPAQAAAVFRDYLPVEAVARFLRLPGSSPFAENRAGVFDDAAVAGAELPILAQITRQELGGYLLSTLLRDCDACSMAHSLEVRPILLDHVLVEHAFALPDGAKLREGRGKAALTEAVRDRIAPGCWQRRKSGFEIPFGRWIVQGLRERFLELLEGAHARALFTPAYRQAVWAGLDDEATARRHWRWLALLAWLEKSGAEVTGA